MKKIRHSIADDEFIRSNVPVTKEEVRSIVISKLQLFEGCTLLDVGAGTGSVSIEAALSMEDGTVYSFEKKPEALELIKENCKKFEVSNINIIAGDAPESMKDIAHCDRAFIGGSSGFLKDIVSYIETIISKEGRIVITAITLETVEEALSYFKKSNFQYELIQVAISRTVKAGDKNMLRALNPVFVITAWKI